MFRKSLAGRYGVALISLKASDEGGNPRVARLDTAWVTAVPGRSDKVRLGDSIDQAGSWGQPTRFAGLHYGTTIGDLPAPAAGPGWSAACSRLIAPPGCQQHDLSGVTDGAPALTEVRSAPFALTPPGLVDRGYAVGFLRHNYGLDGDRYGPPFASATLRHGVSERLTTELRGSAQQGAESGGIAFRAQVPGLGVLSAATAASRSEAGIGRLAQTGFQYREAGFTASIRSQWAGSRFRQLGIGDARIPPRFWSAARVTYEGARQGALRVGYDVLAGYGEALTRIVHGTYRVAVGRASALTLSMSRTLEPEPNTSLMLAIAFPLDTP